MKKIQPLIFLHSTRHKTHRKL